MHIEIQTHSKSAKTEKKSRADQREIEKKKKIADQRERERKQPL